MRICAADGRPISSHVLVIDNRDYHRKTCYCHTVHGLPRGEKQPCQICEPRAGKVEQKPDATRAAKRTGRKPRAVLVSPM